MMAMQAILKAQALSLSQSIPLSATLSEPSQLENHPTMTIRINELMEALGSANEAVNRLPQVTAELRSLTSELDRAKAQIERLTRANDAVNADLANARDAARTIGAERDEAQFRTLELEEKLQSISSVMGKALGLVVPPQDKPTEPEVERTPEPSHVDEVKVDEPVTPVYNPETRRVDYSHIDKEQSDYDDWRREREASFIQELDYHTPIEAPEVASQDPPASTSTALSGDGHHSETSDGYTPVPPVTSTSEEPSAQPIAEPAALPFSGREWKSKPPQMTWKEFVSLGGERPYWMTEHEASYASYT